MPLVLEDILDPQFTAANFGLRRGKSQHQVIRHLQGQVKAGKDWGIAVDLASFFDEIHPRSDPQANSASARRRALRHPDRLSALGRCHDRRAAGGYDQGLPKGSPLSPMVSTIVPNELDQPLESRHLGYADRPMTS